MLSYLSFKISLRDKLLSSNFINSKRVDQDWKGKIKGLEKEEEWEKHFDGLVFNSKEGFNIYELSEDLLKEYTYWRKKRNDCAHGKREIFSQATVQMFWDFLRINFVRFQVLGENEYIISKLFDDFKYHNNELSIITTIMQMVALDRNDIINILNKVDSKIGAFFDCRDDISNIYGLDRFWKVIKSHDKDLNNAFLLFVCKDFQTFDRFNKVMPELLLMAKEYDFRFINEEIVEEILSDRFDHRRMWYYTVELLKILDCETALHIIDKITLRAPYYQPNDIEIDMLKKVGYFQSWKNRLFDQKKVDRDSSGTSYIGDWLNRVNIFVVLNNIDWDESVFNAIEKILEWDSEIHGRINSTSNYYAFLDFRSELKERYGNEIKKCIETYRSFDTDLYPYTKYFIDSDTDEGCSR